MTIILQTAGIIVLVVLTSVSFWRNRSTFKTQLKKLQTKHEEYVELCILHFLSTFDKNNERPILQASQ